MPTSATGIELGRTSELDRNDNERLIEQAFSLQAQ